MSEILVISTYLYGIALGLYVGWSIWRKPNLVYKLNTTTPSEIMANATMKVLFTQEELNSDTFMKLEILMQHAKMTKDPFEFMSRHIIAMKDAKYSNKK